MHLCGDLNVEMEKKNKISYESVVAKYGGPLLKRRLSIKRIGLAETAANDYSASNWCGQRGNIAARSVLSFRSWKS